MSNDPIETTSKSLQQLLVAMTQVAHQIARIAEVREHRRLNAPSTPPDHKVRTDLARRIR